MDLKAPFFAVSDDVQLELLNRRLAYAAAHSRFYRKTLGEPDTLHSLCDLKKLPFTDSGALLNHGKEMLCVRADEIMRIVSLRSSGTTGAVKRLYFTEGDLKRTVTFFAEGMSLLCGAGDSVGIFFPCETPDGLGDLLSRGLRQIGAKAFSCTGCHDGGALADLLAAHRPDVLVGMPRQIRMAAMLLPELCPKAVLLSADYVSDSLRRFLQDAWDCQVFEHYGMTEFCYGGAVEGPEHEGMLVRRDELLMEIVDPVTGRSLEDGETGEIVITTLRREAMPLIRYRTGDIGTMRNGRLLHVGGRADDRLSPKLEDLLGGFEAVVDYALFLNRETHSAFLRVVHRGLDKGALDEPRSLLADALPGTELSIELHRISDIRAVPLHSSKRKVIYMCKTNKTP